MVAVVAAVAVTVAVAAGVASAVAAGVPAAAGVVTSAPILGGGGRLMTLTPMTLQSAMLLKAQSCSYRRKSPQMSRAMIGTACRRTARWQVPLARRQRRSIWSSSVVVVVAAAVAGRGRRGGYGDGARRRFLWR